VSKLYIASSAGIHLHKPIGVCRVPVAGGNICGKPFFPGEERKQAAHAATCAVENHEHLVAYMEQRRPSVMRPQDEEYAAWVRRNSKLIIAGRVRM
jgi:hypothetical protein